MEYSNDFSKASWTALLSYIPAGNGGILQVTDPAGAPILGDSTASWFTEQQHTSVNLMFWNISSRFLIASLALASILLSASALTLSITQNHPLRLGEAR